MLKVKAFFPGSSSSPTGYPTARGGKGEAWSGGPRLGGWGPLPARGSVVPWSLEGEVRAGAEKCLGSGFLTDRLQMGLPFVLESGSRCWRGTWVLLLMPF